jgi:hypothetical protein
MHSPSRVPGTIFPQRIYGIDYKLEYFIITITLGAWKLLVVQGIKEWLDGEFIKTINAHFEGEFFLPEIDSKEFGLDNCCKVRVEGSRVRIFVPLTKNKIPLIKNKKGKEANFVGVCRTLGVLFMRLNHLFWARDEYPKDTSNLGDPLIPQLYHIDSGFGTGLYHAASFDAYFAAPAVKIFADHSRETIPSAQNAMLQHYIAGARNKHEVKLMSSLFRARIRELGTLDYSTAGNCACFGAMPESYNLEHGLTLTSHNIDTAWQQFNLLVGLAKTAKWLEKEYLLRRSA